MTTRMDYLDAMRVLQSKTPPPQWSRLEAACNLIVIDYTTGGSSSLPPTTDEIALVNFAATMA
jgi:hypothetical protein